MTTPSAFTASESKSTLRLSPLPLPSTAPADISTLHLPRILCLHGGGTNARIFRTQCRALRLHLEPYFRLVFADAPFFSPAGPDVDTVYSEWGPFRSWQRPGFGPGSGLALLGPDQGVIIESIEEQIELAMDEDDEAGATGPVVGLLGFSQGAKMAASLLLRQQEQSEEKARRQSSTRETNYRFAVIMAGRAPLMAMDPEMGKAERDDPPLLRLPTIHVHGMQDFGLSFHRVMLRHCCAKGTTRLIEWDGNHRLPIKTTDVAPVVDEILDVAKKTGALKN